MLMGASPLLACLNDTSVTRAESEFRSSYDAPPPAAKPPAYRGLNPWGIAALALCGGISAGLLVMKPRRNKSGKP